MDDRRPTVTNVSTRIACVVVDATDPATLARFWSAATGWPMTSQDAGPVVAPDQAAAGPVLRFVPVAEQKPSVKNRLHLDLSSASAAAQAATVRRLLDLGAAPVDIGQGGVPWVVLGDPEGNEFCVLEPRDTYRDCGPIAALVVDANHPATLTRFWSAAAGWPIVQVGEGFGALRAGLPGPFVEFLPTNHPKTTTNRLHVGLAPSPGSDRTAELARLVGLGARRIEARHARADQQPAGQGSAGQHSDPWAVLADPEGNEFVPLDPR